ncbi:hypothetical protein ASA1KI_24990 [Opitutales bacterium ASA1]|nr:hypothetical protein ASA1KI_24990 [Opitutales bacterium ASA1]
MFLKTLRAAWREAGVGGSVGVEVGELSRWRVRVQTKDARGGDGIHGRDRSRVPKRLVVAMAHRLPAQSAP